MERKTIISEIGKVREFDTDYSYGDAPIKISDMRDFLLEAEGDGATHFTVKSDICDNSLDDIQLQPVKVEIESDLDYRTRIADAKSRKLAMENVAKAREKALYEELKLKYEPK